MSRYRFLLLLLVITIFCGENFLCTAESQTSPTQLADDLILVCPSSLVPAMGEWMAFRSGQGHGIHLLSEFTDAKSITRGVRKIVAESLRKPTAVLLVGDTALVPTAYIAADVTARYSDDPMIATDNAFADLNDDGIPELAVGRISVENAEQLLPILAKIIEYETSLPRGEWLRTIHLVAGVGGFSPLLDGVIESSARYILESLIPVAYRVTITLAQWRSPYCPDPYLLRPMTIERLNEGGFCWMYLGHGYRKGLDVMVTPAGDFPLFLQGDSQFVQCREGLPLAIFFACHAGALDCDGVSLAEDLLRRPRGPVAVVAASRVTMPYGMGAFGVELAERLMQKRAATLGTLFLEAKRGMITSWQKADTNSDAKSEPKSITHAATNDTKVQLRPIRDVLDSTAKMFDPGASLEKQRREHIALFNLFGDPLLRLPQPVPMTINVSVRGKTIFVEGRAAQPLEGIAFVELTQREGRATTSRTKFDISDASRAEFQQAYTQANSDSTKFGITVSCHNGRFTAEIPMPTNFSSASTTSAMPASILRTSSLRTHHAKNELFIRAIILSETAFSLGAEKIEF